MSDTNTICPCGTPHTAQERFYVSVVNGSRVGLVAGPFATHEEALLMVGPSRALVEKIDPWAHFYAFGTVSKAAPFATPGTRNEALGVIPAFQQALEPFDESSIPEVMDERSTIRRDTEYVRRAQQCYVEGYEARLAMLHPMRRNGQGKEMQQRESKWIYAFRSDGACPGVEPECSALFGEHRVWPAHERERWTAGFLAADALCAEKGLAHATARHPKHVPRKKPVALAEPLDAFPDTEMTKSEAKAFWDRHRGVHHAPTTADEQE